MCKCAPDWSKAVRWSLNKVCVIGSTQNHLHPQWQTCPFHLHSANDPSIQPWGLLHQFKTSHAKRSLQIWGEKAPHARGIWLKHSVPAAPHFDANVWQPCRFKIWGRGGRRKKWAREGECNWGASLWDPDANPKCSQGWKQKQHGCSTGHIGSFNKSTFSHTKAREAFPEGSHPTSPRTASTLTHTPQPIPVLARELPTSSTHHQTSLVCSGAVKRIILKPTGSSPLIEAGVQSGMWLGLGNFTVD